LGVCSTTEEKSETNGYCSEALEESCPGCESEEGRSAKQFIHELRQGQEISQREIDNVSVLASNRNVPSVLNHEHANGVHPQALDESAAVSEQTVVPRPPGLWLLTAILLANPVIHGAALLVGQQWLNYGSPRAWDAFVYVLIAPFVGTLMLCRHERARFSVYVFLSCEIVRAISIESLTLGVLSLAAILYLQLPAARRYHPSVDPRGVLRRIRLRR
jgi:hypothetical protein